MRRAQLSSTSHSTFPSQHYLTIRSSIDANAPKRENRRRHLSAQLGNIHHWHMPAHLNGSYCAMHMHWLSVLGGNSLRVTHQRESSTRTFVDYVIFGEMFVGWVYHNRLTRRRAQVGAFRSSWRIQLRLHSRSDFGRTKMMGVIRKCLFLCAKRGLLLIECIVYVWHMLNCLLHTLFGIEYDWSCENLANLLYLTTTFIIRQILKE